MPLTNPDNLPQPLVAAIQAARDSYEGPGFDYDFKRVSVTTLIKPTKAVALAYLHKHELPDESATDNMWSMIGTGIHHWIAKATNRPGTELRLEAQLVVNGTEWTISGQADDYHEGILTDWKTTSVFAAKKPQPDWERQLAIYEWLLRENGLDVIHKRIYAILRDWGPRYANDFPAPFAVFSYPTNRKHEDVTSLVRARIALLEMALTMPSMGQCSVQETWDGNRCKRYCPALPFCDQGKAAK